MPTITVTRFQPMRGTDAEALWLEGEASYVNRGKAGRTFVTPPHPENIGWVGYVDGAPAGIQVCRTFAGADHTWGLLSWTRREFRRLGVFRAIQIQVEIDLLASGISAIQSSVVEGEDAEATVAAIVARGGVSTGTRMVATATGPVVYEDFRRTFFSRLV